MRHTVPKENQNGAVSFCVHGAAGKIASSDFTTPKLIQRLQAGLPFNELEYLQTAIDVPMEKLASIIGMSKATLHRRKNEGRLAPAESDRVIRFARLMGRAIEVMETQDKARQWLTSPQFGLGGAVPLEYAETELGAREVENLLGRIEYGVYT
jgi:putative toxin-antitoxin system antitoxin component (TIGR02293 family)